MNSCIVQQSPFSRLICLAFRRKQCKRVKTNQHKDKNFTDILFILKVYQYFNKTVSFTFNYFRYIPLKVL